MSTMPGTKKHSRPREPGKTARTLFRAGLEWSRDNLFSTPLNTVLTLAGVGLVIMAGVPLVNWLVIDAYWVGSTPRALPRQNCRLLAVCPGALRPVHVRALPGD